MLVTQALQHLIGGPSYSDDGNVLLTNLFGCLTVAKKVCKDSECLFLAYLA